MVHNINLIIFRLSDFVKLTLTKNIYLDPSIHGLRDLMGKSQFLERKVRLTKFWFLIYGWREDQVLNLW